MTIKLGFELLSPCEITMKADEMGESKGKERKVVLLLLAILAGIFIGLAANFNIVATYQTGLAPSLTALIGGFVFSLGLVLVLIAGAELFTGNTLLIISFLTGKINSFQLMRNWVIVFIGNFIGSLIMVYLVFYARPWLGGREAFAFHALHIAVNKVNLSFMTAFVRGILANILVVLAVWLSYSGRTLVDKVIAVVFPITAFVASGFEHSIANMFYVPLGLFLKGFEPVRTAFLTRYPSASLDSLSWTAFLEANLLPVTLGNVVGGVCFVGALYWYVHIACPRTNGTLVRRRKLIEQLKKEREEDQKEKVKRAETE